MYVVIIEALGSVTFVAKSRVAEDTASISFAVYIVTPPYSDLSYIMLINVKQASTYPDGALREGFEREPSNDSLLIFSFT